MPPRSFLSLVLGVALWLFPAAAPHRASVGTARWGEAHAAVFDAARLPERVEAGARVPQLTPVRGPGASPSEAAPATPRFHVAPRRVVAFDRTARRLPPPRRLAFPIEATAPPARLS